MGDVINLPQRAARRSDTSAVLAGLMAQESSGELEGSIHIAATMHGTEFHVLGSCAERLQLGVLAMVKGLGIITDKIVATGSAGNTRSDSVVAIWDSTLPRTPRRLPRRLRDASDLEDLGKWPGK